MDNFATKICLQCQKTLSGRSDKKFCDAYCRNIYNNQHKADDDRNITLINSQIRKNRRVLKSLAPEGKATVRKDVLDQMGYDYRYFSGLFKSKQTLYYLVYDYAFAPIMDNGKEKALIVQRQDYMNRLGFEVWKK
jgi:hypothetical protein